MFAKGSIAAGIAMLTGTVSGGLVAQFTNLGVPYIMRIVALGLTFVIAFVMMHDEGFQAKDANVVLSTKCGTWFPSQSSSVFAIVRSDG